MRDYIKPESESIALNLSEGIASSGKTIQVIVRKDGTTVFDNYTEDCDDKTLIDKFKDWLLGN